MEALSTRRGRSPRRERREKRGDVAPTAEEGELDVRLQDEQDEDIDRRDQAREGCSTNEVSEVL